MNAHLYYNASHIREYDHRGVEVKELFPGLHDEVRVYKISMKAGSSFSPELYADWSVLNVFGHIHNSDAFLKDPYAIHRLNTVCFYAPDYANAPYTIYAVTDFEFLQFVAHMDSHDLDESIDSILALPFFRTEAQCDRYDQDCKTAGTISRTVLFGEFDRLGRLTCGICEAWDCNGTIEKGHPEVHQWNYAVDGANYWMKVGSESEADICTRAAGDVDFIPAGPDHTLYADHNCHLHYVWVEFNTHKRGK